MYKNVNGKEVQMTPEETQARQEEKELVEAKMAEYELKEKYKDDRKSKYPTTDDLVVAIWERVVENRPETSNALQVKREEVKAKYPKPVA